RHCSLLRLQTELFRFHAPRFDNLAAPIDLQHFAYAVGNKQVARAIERHSTGYESWPDLLQIAFAVENLNPRIVTVAHINSPIRPDSDGMRNVELSRRRAFVAPRLKKLAVTVEFHDPAVAIAVGDIHVSR